MSTPPLISVVIPSYNCARYVAEAIRSVFSQTWRPIELVVVDDGSTDESRDVIVETVAANSIDSVVYLEQENQGAHAAIMRGLEVARGELLSILNCDDFYAPDRFARLAPYVLAGHQLAFSGLHFVDDASQRLPRSHAWPTWYASALRDADDCPSIGYALLRHNFSVTSGNFVFTRALYAKLGGFSSHKFVHDWDFLLRSVFYSEPAFVSEPLMSYRIHGTNTTESVRHLLFEEASEVFARFVERCRVEVPPNTLAPCQTHWPVYFQDFAGRYAPFFAPDRKLSEILDLHR